MNHQDVRTALAHTQAWRKSTYSDMANNCVEITTELPGWVGVRDSKLGHDSPVLAFTHHEWQALVDGIRDGELNA
ncbi:MAG: DUF397 domain-containing protein [Pseudonocardia sp.]